MTLFAGFTSLETLLERLNEVEGIDHARPVYALSITDTTDDSRGMSVQRTAILAGQPQPGDTAYYVRIPTARLEFLHGQPFSKNHEEQHEKALDAWATVLACLDGQGIDTIPAVSAMPKALQLLDGTACCLRNQPPPAPAVPPTTAGPTDEEN